jgi:hypothetical protein
MWLSDPVPSSPSQLVATRPEIFSLDESRQSSATMTPDSSVGPNDVSIAASVPVENSDVALPEQAIDSAALFREIELSTDRLFFISFRIPGTVALIFCLADFALHTIIVIFGSI